MPIEEKKKDREREKERERKGEKKKNMGDPVYPLSIIGWAYSALARTRH